jgi:hypothetical protein
MAQMIVKHMPNFVLIKAFGSKLRGTKIGEAAELLKLNLIKYGLDKNKLDIVEFESEAVDKFLANLEDNHAYIVLSQEQIGEVISKIEEFNCSKKGLN